MDFGHKLTDSIFPSIADIMFSCRRLMMTVGIFSRKCVFDAGEKNREGYVLAFSSSRITLDPNFLQHDPVGPVHFQTPMKVLAVHWQEEILREIEQTLRPEGWYVRSTTNGLDGLLCARAESYDLIFCCLNLPMVSGIELVRSVRNLSANRNTPIILLSDGEETEGQRLLISRLRTDWLTMAEISSMKDLKI